MQTGLPEENLIAVTIRVPAAIAQQFGPDLESIGRRLLEQAAAEGYRSNQLSRGQVSQLLGLDWAETEEFLAKRHCDRHYGLNDLDQDRLNLDRILGPA
jgi:predicted HTH domain antitoxin